MEPVFLYDTTLRDGTQGENINFTSEEKLVVAQKLDDFGIHYIEGGWPGSNPRDMKFFELAQKMEFKNSRLTAFGSTRRPGIAPEDDSNLKALIESQAEVVAIFGKTWDLHVEKVMGISLSENLSMIKDSLAYLKEQEREVIYDAEHFFDGYKDNKEYALKTLSAAAEGGAGFIVFCDTNGGSLPHEIEEIVKTALEYLEQNFGNTVKTGIHTHNDCGLAVANTISAVRAGVTLVQGTINGYGERCGNADLTSIIPVLSKKMNVSCMTDENLKKTKQVSRFISEKANMIPQKNRPFTGSSAFAHKGGIHVSAVQKDPKAYEHLDPSLVGNKRRVLISDLSGKSNIEYKAKELGIDLSGTYNSKEIVTRIKDMEQKGYQYDAADGSFAIFMEKATGKFSPFFELKSFRINTEKDKDGTCHSFATIKITVNGKDELTAEEGNGPVSALDNALRKALERFYMTNLDAMHLVDYKVRVLDGRDGTSAKVRVLIDSRDEEEIWSTMGVSEDIIEASWQALVDSFQYKLSKCYKNEKLTTDYDSRDRH